MHNAWRTAPACRYHKPREADKASKAGAKAPPRKAKAKRQAKGASASASTETKAAYVLTFEPLVCGGPVNRAVKQRMNWDFS